MLPAREGLKLIYANAVSTQSVKATLDEMLARGLPKELYNKYLNEAIDIGIIPVAGRSIIDGRIVTEADILKRGDILEKIPADFKNNRYFYGVG
jgi:hypothetical protein